MPPIIFFLPACDRSGGVRVTIEMANQLLKKGFAVRIACKKISLFRKLKSLLLHYLGREGNWIHHFLGEIAWYRSVHDMSFANNERVIAVGSLTVQEVDSIQKPVIKIRYCHGFNNFKPELMDIAWRKISMPTIAVAPALVPKLEQLSQSTILGVVPNGIYTSEYFVQRNVVRNGIGTIYGMNKYKAPEFTFQLLNQLHHLLPDLPVYVFGSSKKPKGLYAHSYWRYPSIHHSRNIYNRSLIWLITSNSEGFSLPILEAMACGCAVISTATDGAKSIIQNGYNGMIVPINDQAVFLDTITMLLRDTDMREKLVAHGLETVKQYSWENAAQKMVEVLSKVSV